MRVLCPIHYPVFGGPHNLLAALRPPLEEAGVELTAVLPEEPGDAVARLEREGVEVATMPLRRARATRDPRHVLSLVRDFGADVSRLAALARERDADIVLLTGLVNPHGAVAGRLAGRAVVWQVVDSRTPAPVRRVMMPVVGRLADSVMFWGRALADLHAAESLPRPTFVFGPPVDSTRFRPSAERRAAKRRELGIPEDAFVVGMVANLTPMKGVEYFIRAARTILDEESEAWFVVVGPRHASQEAYNRVLDEEIARAGLPAERLRMVGARSDLELWYPAMDAKLVTSLPASEGIPTTTAEAMACGVPVVATNVGAVREAVEHDVTGYLVPPHDARAVADRTLELRRDGDLRARMSASAHRAARERFSLEACTRVHLEAFSAALSNAARRRTRPLPKSRAPRATAPEGE